MITSCKDRAAGPVVPAPEPRTDIEKEDLLRMVRDADRPYILINFFATWCRPCVEELPELVELQKDPDSRVKVLLVSIDKVADLEKLPDFLGEFGVDFETYARPEGASYLIKQMYPVWDGSIPLSLLYDKNGRRLEIFRGMTTRGEIEMHANKHQKMGS